MKVSGQQPAWLSELKAGQARDAEQKQAQGRAHGPEGSLKPVPGRTSLTLHRIKEAIANTPDVRSDKVAALRERIAAGNYQVDAQRLAGNMLNSALREDIEPS